MVVFGLGNNNNNIHNININNNNNNNTTSNINNHSSPQFTYNRERYKDSVGVIRFLLSQTLILLGIFQNKKNNIPTLCPQCNSVNNSNSNSNNNNINNNSNKSNRMIFRLIILYTFVIWFINHCGFIHISAHPILNTGYLFALPPIIGYIGGIAVRHHYSSSSHHHNDVVVGDRHHHQRGNSNSAGGRRNNHYHPELVMGGTSDSDSFLNEKSIHRLNSALECMGDKCMSPEYMFSDQHSSISSGIGGALILSDGDHHHQQVLKQQQQQHQSTLTNRQHPSTSTSYIGHQFGIFDKIAKKLQTVSGNTFDFSYKGGEVGGIEGEEHKDIDHNNHNNHLHNSQNHLSTPISAYQEAIELSNHYLPGRKVKNVASIYRDVNIQQPKHYYDYESYNIVWSNPDNYEIINKIGRGKYSEVFCGETVEDPQKIVIKVLKPIQKHKIQREIKILKNLEGGVNIIPLLDVVKDPISKTKSLIFPFVNKTDVRELINYLNDYDLRYYMFELLKAIDFTHSRGIMHRDIKPHNIAIDHQNRKLYLLDWGLAEFYHPYRTYNIKVASRHYKPPELLVNMYDYDYSLDLWSVGCLFAGLILNRDPFFNGINNDDQLVQIVKVLGSEDFYNYLDKYGLEISEELQDMIKPSTKKDWDIFIPFENDDIAHPLAIDFLNSLLQYDPQLRPTAKEAMNHPYFAPFNQQPPPPKTTTTK